MGIGMAGMEGIPETPGPADGCGPTPGGSAGIFGITGRRGMAGMAGPPGADCSPTPGGIFGMAGIGGGAGKPAGGDCGPTPGGIAGMAGKPGGGADGFSTAGLSRTKLRLFGKSRVNSLELRSKMSTGFGQLVAVISTRKKFVPTV